MAEAINKLKNQELFESEEEALVGQEGAWKATFAFAESLAVKSTLKLRIPDIIAQKGPKAALTISEIAKELPSESPDLDLLHRIMRFLVSKGFFSKVQGDTESETRYGLTPTSKWMVADNKASIAPMLLLLNDDVTISPWYHFDECVLRGGIPFVEAHGKTPWEYASGDPRYNRLFNEAMASSTLVLTKALLSTYKGFQTISSLVDVGGGTGAALAEIVRAYPNITTAINCDLKHVVETAPDFPGVKHVAGNMFEKVPPADAVFLKWIMHDWGDEDCVKILKKCKEAIPPSGKVVIMDVVLEDEKRGIKASMDPSLGLANDLEMAACNMRGRERTPSEWNNILSLSGLARFNIISLPSVHSLIEAFPS